MTRLPVSNPGRLTDGIRRGNNSPGDDVVSIQQRSGHRFSNSINVDGRSGEERSDEARGGSEKRGEHQGSEPTNVETVLSAGDPVRETLPCTCEVSHFAPLLDIKRLEGAGTQLGFKGALGREIGGDKLQRGTNSTTHAAAGSGRGLRDVEGLTAGGHQGYNDAKRELHGMLVDLGVLQIDTVLIL